MRYFFIFILFSIQIFASSSKKDVFKALETYGKVLNYIQERYYKESDIDKLIYSSIKDMVQSLDPHSEFFSPEEFEVFDKELDGEIIGSGVYFDIKDDEMIVRRVHKNSPAEKSGVKAGIIIEKINGVEVYGVGKNRIETLLSGVEGTEIILEFYENSKLKKISFKLSKLQVIPFEIVKISDNTLYINITIFQNRLTEELKKELQNRKEDRFIIDLRGNPGGYVNEAVDLSDLFISKGIIVSSKERNSAEHFYKASRKAPFTTQKIYLLVDHNTASAAEIFAAAIKENKRGLLIGNRTFGKGTIQSIYELSDGSALKLTVTLYYTPKRNLIQGVGVKPHVILPKYFDFDSTISRESDIENAIKGGDNKSDLNIPDFLKNDRQFETALSFCDE
ncbi:S41 family peptidase [bacterium]|nr:S41 family peptidase [bacterium]